MIRWGSILAVALMWPVAAIAQPTPADIGEARALYAAGQAAALAERWSDAAVNFDRAYQLSGAPPALFNLAFALRSMGAYQRASAAFSTLLTLHGNELDEATTSRAESLLHEVRGRTAIVELDGLDSDAYHLELDGVRMPDAGERPWSVVLDPGMHQLRLSRAGFRSFDWAGALDPGERRALLVQMLRVPIVVAPSVDTGSSIIRSPWLWTLVGVVLVGAAVAIAVPLSRRDTQLAPQSMRSYRL